jgi:hypothetical protein
LEGKSGKSYEVRHIQLERILDLPDSFGRVLEQIQGAVEKRVAAGPTPIGTLAKLGSRLKKSGKNAKRLLVDQDEIKELNRRLQEVVEEFQVRSYSLAGAALMLNIPGRDSHERRAVYTSRARPVCRYSGTRQTARGCNSEGVTGCRQQ